MKTISAVINARLQSSRIPRKLVRPFAGTTLIEIALEKLNKMDFFEHRYLAVAEEELKTYIKNYCNVELLERSMEAVKRGFNDLKTVNAHYLEVKSDYIFWLNPCHPLLSIETVKKAFNIFQHTEYPSYTAVVPTTEWLFTLEGEPFTNPDPRKASTHHSNRFFKVAHCFHIFLKEYFRKTGLNWSMQKDDPYLIEVPIEEVFDSDTPLEFRIAELIYMDRIKGI